MSDGKTSTVPHFGRSPESWEQDLEALQNPLESKTEVTMNGIKHALLSTFAVLAISGAAIGAGGSGGSGVGGIYGSDSTYDTGGKVESSLPCMSVVGFGTGTEIGFSTASSWNGIGIDTGKPRIDAMDSGGTLNSGRTGISTGIAKTDTGVSSTGTKFGFYTSSTTNGIGIDSGKPHEDVNDSGSTLMSGRTGISTGIRKTAPC